MADEGTEGQAEAYERAAMPPRNMGHEVGS